MLLELDVACTAGDLSTVSMKCCQIRAVTFQAAFKWFVRKKFSGQMITSARGGGQGWIASVGDREIRWNSLTLARQNRAQEMSKILSGGSGGHKKMRRWSGVGLWRERHGTTDYGEPEQYGAQGWKWTEREIPSGDRCTTDGLQAMEW